MKKKVSINLTDLDIFTDLVRLIKEMTKDERIEESIREEYRQKVLALSTPKDCNNNQSLGVE